MRRRRVTFYGHIKRMNEKRLTTKLLNYFDRNPKIQIPWIKEVRKDMAEMKIYGEEVERRKEFKGFGGFQVQEKEQRKLELNGQKKEGNNTLKELKSTGRKEGREKDIHQKLFHVVHSVAQNRKKKKKKINILTLKLSTLPIITITFSPTSSYPTSYYFDFLYPL
ncbi:hypothetical protein RI129_010540 [Pyrocoelia pectoralis]|uniref:Uncharacterized protein n=1 Tax=Pyrocoelia pectoralis TaxID=417401 RepID=A0AAN7V4A8_9COLE